MRAVLSVLLVAAVGATAARAQQLTAAGQPAQLDIRTAGERALRISLRPVATSDTVFTTPAIAERAYASAAVSVRTLAAPVTRRIGALTVTVTRAPLTVTVTRGANDVVQRISFRDDGAVTFALDGQPVLGMGEGGPRPQQGQPWRTAPIQFDRSGKLDTMEPRWQSDAYGSRNPSHMLVGTNGWAIYMPTPWSQVDLTRADTGVFVPWQPTEADRAPQNERNQQQATGKGKPPVSKVVAGVYDLFVFDARDPAVLMKDFATITGPAALPPKWALGYMQSHRTIEDETQLIGILDTFRSKRIPVDAVIYLGTGFTPRGWNTRQPSFDFNPDVFKRDGKTVIADMHARNVKVVVHMVPWDRDRLPTLHGTIPAKPGETLDASHIQNYWRQHVGLFDAGIDAFWPDEGDWFNLFERVTRHQMYYQGPLSTRSNTRPWSLHRNGYPGIAQWGGWVWSGDTEASWKSLEGQIAVGINYGLSVAPFWGSDIAGFYANNELTGELYARWFQFGAFSASFRSHGRNWQLRLPWGWGLNNFGPREYNNTNAPIPDDDRRNILATELNNPAIEPVVKTYAELRYQLMPYTYTLAWEARATGMPLTRAMWIHYPNDRSARGLGSQYMWGKDLLVAPVFVKGASSRAVYLPEGTWYDWWTNASEAGGRTVTRSVDLATMPIYVRAGAIIPFDPVRQYTSEPVSEPTTIKVYRGANGEFTLYDDDGISQDYLEKRGTWTRMTWNDARHELTLQPGAPSGFTNIPARRTFIVEMLPEGTKKNVTYSGSAVRVTF
ncbi:MAG TPA: TIM-barrel domain-containing protein [Gemmatimonadaceae bacterium]|nr:TIM-barrel domain-containing protein [Gemmatimonadaceae bacterium]